MEDKGTKNMDTLLDMVLDEEKLVTYVFLSNKLSIHVNESKMLLHQAVKKIPEQNPNVELNVNYIISGMLDNDIAKTVVCTEDELAKLKNLFKIIFFEHVYSVSKGTPRVDRTLLLGSTKLEDSVYCSGVITSKNCIKRTASEIGSLKSCSQELVALKEEKASKPPIKVKKEDNSQFKEPEKKDVIDKSEKTILPSNIKVEKCSPKKDVKQKLNQVSIKQKGIAVFLHKTNGSTAKKEVSNIEGKSKVNCFEKTDGEEAKIKKIPDEFPAQAKVNHKNKEEKINLEAPEKSLNEVKPIDKSKLQTITKKNLKVDKKRKRVLSVPQSDSDNEEVDPFVDEEQMDVQNESEDEIPPTPTVNTIKITSGITNPRKKRKIVDKTYIGEDSYMVTKKEEVYESCSDDEEVEVSKENVGSINTTKAKTSPKESKKSTKTSKKKTSPPQTGKQATMLNYFKKDRN